MLKFLLLAALTINSYSECVHEFSKTKEEIEQIAKTQRVFILKKDQRFEEYGPHLNLQSSKEYTIQLSHQTLKPEIDKDYNDRYLEYYSYAHIQDFLSNINSDLTNINYTYKTIGKSLEGRDLYFLAPKKISKDKKTIVMFGRHHGDEGTANWIIEGFLRKFIKDKNFRENYQLVLYPMVNPDGAENQSRYNANGRDLNRVWNSNSENSYDEVKVIQNHFLKTVGNADIMLDMHGSYYEDFIYRVDKNFISRDFYNTQQSFIDTLASFDPFQNGNFQVSNGHPKMARIFFVRNFNINALTHETPRDIRKKGNRTIRDLKDQGVALLETVRKEVR